MIKINNYWINFFAHFTIMTLAMTLYCAIDGKDHSFVSIRIVIALIYAVLFPIFKSK